MASNSTAFKKIGKFIWISFRFVAFGVAGFLIMMYFLLAFFARIIEHDLSLVHPLLSFPLALIGALMMLFGAGEWGRWAWLWVFFSIPLSMLVCGFIGFGGKEIFLVVAMVAAIITYLAVRYYYKREIIKGVAG